MLGSRIRKCLAMGTSGVCGAHVDMSAEQKSERLLLPKQRLIYFFDGQCALRSIISVMNFHAGYGGYHELLTVEAGGVVLCNHL